MEEPEYLSVFVDDGQLTNNEMAGVYKALSTSGDNDIDTMQELAVVQEHIEALFNEKLKQMPTETLQANTVLVNKLFFELIKYSDAHGYKRIGFIFIGFCDYFDLDFSKVYLSQHEKIQLLIQKTLKKLIGAKRFDKLKREAELEKTGGVKVTNLFSMFQK